MPVDDWQFWTVTALALGAFALIARPLFPRRRGQADCCGGPGSRAKPKRTALTISAHRSRDDTDER